MFAYNLCFEMLILTHSTEYRYTFLYFVLNTHAYNTYIYIHVQKNIFCDLWNKNPFLLRNIICILYILIFILVSHSHENLLGPKEFEDKFLAQKAEQVTWYVLHRFAIMYSLRQACAGFVRVTKCALASSTVLQTTSRTIPAYFNSRKNIFSFFDVAF